MNRTAVASSLPAPPPPASAAPALAEWLVLACVVSLAALSVWLLITPMRALFVRVPISHDEGWNAVHTLRLMTGGALYPPVASGITINYPPLSFYVVGALGRMIGDFIFAGRMVALFAQGIVAINVMLIARRIGADGLFAAIAALSFLLFAQIYLSDFIAMDDPQWLGHALQTSGLVLLLKGDLRAIGWRRLAATMLLMLLGGLCKQSLVALPLSVTLWIGLQSRPMLGRWLALCAAGLTFVLALAWAAYGRDAFDQVVFNPRNFSLGMLLWVAQNLALRLLPFVLLAVGGIFVAPCRDGARLIGIYGVIAALTAAVLMSAAGVIYNALFDLIMAIMLAAAMLGQGLSDRLAGRTWTRPAAAPLQALPFFFVAPHADDNYLGLRADLDHQSQWQDAISSIAHADGPVLCAQLSLCYWAGRQSELDFFNFGQRAVRDPQLAIDAAAQVNTEKQAMIEEDNLAGDSRMPSVFNTAVAQHYRVLAKEPTVLRVPAGSPLP